MMFRLPATQTTDACQRAIELPALIMYLTLDEPLITSLPSSGGGASVNQPHVPAGVGSDNLSGGNPATITCQDVMIGMLRDMALTCLSRCRSALHEGTEEHQRRRLEMCCYIDCMVALTLQQPQRPIDRQHAHLIGPPLQTNSSPQQKRSQVRLKPQMAQAQLER